MTERSWEHAFAPKKLVTEAGWKPGDLKLLARYLVSWRERIRKGKDHIEKWEEGNRKKVAEENRLNNYQWVKREALPRSKLHLELWWQRERQWKSLCGMIWCHWPHSSWREAQRVTDWIWLPYSLFRRSGNHHHQCQEATGWVIFKAVYSTVVQFARGTKTALKRIVKVSKYLYG